MANREQRKNREKKKPKADKNKKQKHNPFGGNPAPGQAQPIITTAPKKV